MGNKATSNEHQRNEYWRLSLESYHSVGSFLYETQNPTALQVNTVSISGLPFDAVSVSLSCCRGVLTCLVEAMVEEPDIAVKHEQALGVIDALIVELNNIKKVIVKGNQGFLSGETHVDGRARWKRYAVRMLPNYQSLDDFFMDCNAKGGFPIQGFIRTIDQCLGILGSLYSCGIGQKYFAGTKSSAGDALYFVSCLFDRLDKAMNIALDEPSLKWRALDE